MRVRSLKQCLVTLLVIVLAALPVPAEPLKTGIEYLIPKAQEFQIKVTQIPKQYSWVERELGGQVKQLETGSEIVAENTEPIELKDPYGEVFTLPIGTKFYARLRESKKAKNFHKEGKISLDFYKLELPGYKALDLEGTTFNSGTSAIKRGPKVLAEVGAYAVGGAVAAPLLTLIIASKSLLGLGLASNPYLLGGVGALGAGLGLAYGIKKKGKDFVLEPGTELKLKIEDPWFMVKSLEEKPSKPEFKNDKFKLEILEVKKLRDEFGDNCIRVKFNYENNTGEELRYLSFQLIDSMGKEYEPSISSIDFNLESELPRKAALSLYFPVEFIKTIHELKVLRLRDSKTLAQARIVL